MQCSTPALSLFLCLESLEDQDNHIPCKNRCFDIRILGNARKFTSTFLLNVLFYNLFDAVMDALDGFWPKGVLSTLVCYR